MGLLGGVMSSIKMTDLATTSSMRGVQKRIIFQVLEGKLKYLPILSMLLSTYSQHLA